VLRGDPEVTPRLDMIAHEPRQPALHDLLILGFKGQWSRYFNLGASGAGIGKQQAAEQVAHDSARRIGAADRVLATARLS
jgi:hypothetical protein